MVRVFVDDAFQLPGVQVVAGIVFQVQRHAGAALGAGDFADVKLARAVAHPAHALISGQTGAAAFDRDFVGHDKAGIKAHAKLANQLSVVFLVARELGHEVARATFGNRTQVVDGFLLRHADAVVADGQGFGAGVKAHAHLEFGVGFVQTGIVERFETQFVAGVGGVGNQFAQENFGVGIERMRDELEELGDFGLEGMGLFLHG